MNTTPFYSDASVTLYHSDCIELLKELPDNSIDSVCTDPPYGLGFMGREWDDLPPGVPFAAECLRVLKPGGHMLAFGGSRTWHRLATAVEDAGFEIRDSIAWLYGSGFPKSMDVSKAIDKARRDESAWLTVGEWLKAHREAGGHTRQSLAPLLEGHKNLDSAAANVSNWENGLSFPTVERWAELKSLLSLPDDMDAEVWRLNGRKGSPGEAWELREVTGEYAAGLATGSSGVGGAGMGSERRDIASSKTAKKWQGWGTALKPAFEPIVVGRKPIVSTVASNVLTHGTGALNIDGCRVGDDPIEVHHRTTTTVAASSMSGRSTGSTGTGEYRVGRWPTNVVLDDSQAVKLDGETGVSVSRVGKPRGAESGDGWGMTATGAEYADSGGASRFFPTFHYEAKAPTDERPRDGDLAHPTVKPLDLMRWLVRLVTPPGGTVLEPFAGSGTTAEACVIEGFKCIAVEREATYLSLIVQRLSKPIQVGLDFGESA